MLDSCFPRQFNNRQICDREPEGFKGPILQIDEFKCISAYFTQYCTCNLVAFPRPWSTSIRWFSFDFCSLFTLFLFRHCQTFFIHFFYLFILYQRMGCLLKGRNQRVDHDCLYIRLCDAIFRTPLTMFEYANKF